MAEYNWQRYPQRLSNKGSTNDVRLNGVQEVVGSNPAGPTSGFAMRLLKLSLFNLLFVVAAASAQNAQPSPTQSLPQPTPAPQEQGSSVPGASPAPEAQGVPEILPESKTPPAQSVESPLPFDLIPQGTKPVLPGLPAPNPASAEQQEKDKVRFRQLRTIAQRNPFAIYLLRRARLERTDEGEREFLRLYYITMCDEMRKLEPRLKAIIDGFQNAKVSLVSQWNIRTTIPLRDIHRFDAAQAAKNAQ
jgi:hypothetical protein